MAPRRVRIREVGPRDGFQNEPETISTDDKVRLIDALARTGLERLEVTSFVRADVIPQLADVWETRFVGEAHAHRARIGAVLAATRGRGVLQERLLVRFEVDVHRVE